MMTCIERQSRGWAIIASMVAAMAGCSASHQSEVAFPADRWSSALPASQGIDAQRLEEAMAYVASICKEDGTRQCMVIRNGYVIWRGPDVDEVHKVWSCTKSFTSAVLGILIADRKCTLDTRAAEVLPALAEHYPEVTLRHFATLTSGYAHAKGDRFTPATPLHAPGERFHYSSASDVYGLMLTRTAGEPLEDVFARRIAEPIGMNRDEWRWGSWGVRNGLAINGGSGEGEAGVSTNARTLARFGHLYLNEGEWAGRQLVPREWVRLSTSVQVNAETPTFLPDAWYARMPGAYGLNWWVNGVTAEGRRRWPHAPPRTFAAQGYKNNICFVVPEWNMVFVRLGTDGGIDEDLYDGFFRRMSGAIADK